MVSVTLKALAEPNRLKMVELLRSEPRSVNEIARILKIRQPQASKHFKILSDAKVVLMETVAQQHIYSLNPEAFYDLDRWINSYETIWNKRLDNLDKYLRSSKTKSKKKGNK